MFRYKLKQNVIDNIHKAVSCGELHLSSNLTEQVVAAIAADNLYFDSAQALTITEMPSTFGISGLIRPFNTVMVTQTNNETG